MKRTSVLKVSGATCIGLSINLAARLTSCYLKNVILLQQNSFFCKAVGFNAQPEKVTIDKSGSNNAALKSINKSHDKHAKIEIRQIKYLNNIVEQDHRFIQRITKQLKGFKSFQPAYTTLIGIELHHMLRKKQHGNSANMPVFEQFYALAA